MLQPQKIIYWRNRFRKSIRGERIAFLVENSYDYVGAQLFSLPCAGFLMAEHWQLAIGGYGLTVWTVQ